MDRQQKLNWFLANEELWNDLDALGKKAVEEGVYSSKLTNIIHALECQIHNCKEMKNLCKSPIESLKRRTYLVASVENFDEIINLREVRDILGIIKHPNRHRDESGFTYYDYAIFKRKQKNKVPKHVIDEMNIIFSGGDIGYTN